MRDCKACPHYPIDCSTVAWCKLEVEQLEKENAELKAQVEKMKCCENCKHCEFKIVSDGSTRAICTRLKGDVCLSNNYDSWEVAE